MLFMVYGELLIVVDVIVICEVFELLVDVDVVCYCSKDDIVEFKKVLKVLCLVFGDIDCFMCVNWILYEWIV